MRKGQGVFVGSPISFFYIGPKIAPDEYFVDLPTWQIPGVYDYYQVSNYGRVYNKYSDKIVTSHPGTDGYLAISLSGTYGTKRFRINRLVMMAFHPIEHPELYVVNHLDCDPLNNFVDNLEWTSRSGNALHAYAHGLMRKGEDSPTSKISNETAEKICKLLADGWKYNDIYLELKDEGVSYPIVQNIGRGIGWKEISTKYNIGPRKHMKRFSKEEVERLCNFFQNNIPEDPTVYFEKAIIECDIDEPECVTHELVVDSISRLYNRETYKKLTSKYSF